MYDDGPARMIRQGPWKIIYQQRSEDEQILLLFDLKDDPAIRNVADDHPDRPGQLLPLIPSRLAC